jgi:hypothetical protein
LIWTRDLSLSAEGCDERTVDGGRLLVFSADGLISVV